MLSFQQKEKKKIQKDKKKKKKKAEIIKITPFKSLGTLGSQQILFFGINSLVVKINSIWVYMHDHQIDSSTESK